MTFASSDRVSFAIMLLDVELGEQSHRSIFFKLDDRDGEAERSRSSRKCISGSWLFFKVTSGCPTVESEGLRRSTVKQRYYS